MKPSVACVLATSVVALMAGKAVADIGGYTFAEFQSMCSTVGGTFETWNNKKLGTCIYPGAGSPQNQQDWFWASQENVENTLDTYKSGGDFDTSRAAHRDMMKQLKLKRGDRDKSR